MSTRQNAVLSQFTPIESLQRKGKLGPQLLATYREFVPLRQRVTKVAVICACSAIGPCEAIRFLAGVGIKFASNVCAIL